MARNRQKQHGRTLFTADSHFGHANIIKHCDRPFADVDEMDRYLIDMWRSVVAPNDTVYFLGDFANWRLPATKIREYFDALTGDVHLIAGNHDHEATRQMPWASVSERTAITVDGTTLILDHYAMRVWNKSRYGALQLHGHSHGALPGNSQQIDVGVDVFGFMPIALPEIKARLETLPPYWTEDHHSPDVCEAQTDGYGR
jgi:calcineurin-like phosphoesterase family protein